MLCLYGRDEAIRNIYRIARIEEPNGRIDTTTELRSTYLDFLDHNQRGMVCNRNEGFFVDDVRLEDKLASAFKVGVLNDLNQADVVGPLYSVDARKKKTDLARKALLHGLSLDEDFALIFHLAVHSVIIRQSRPAEGINASHGGSSSAAIGSIWLVVNDATTTLDLIEMYVHELTHHLLFIDELNHPQFNYEAIVRKENYALSTILRKRRPLDKVVHSIVVGAELLKARSQFIGNEGETLIHPPTHQLANHGIASVESVRSLPNIDELITKHTFDMLAMCLDVFNSKRSEK